MQNQNTTLVIQTRCNQFEKMRIITLIFGFLISLNMFGNEQLEKSMTLTVIPMSEKSQRLNLKFFLKFWILNTFITKVQKLKIGLELLI